MKKVLIVAGVLIVVAGAAAFIPVGGDDGQPVGTHTAGPALELSGFSDAAPETTLQLLFIHHSVGGTLLAEEGPVSGEHAPQCIWESHPNGGGLRRQLEAAGYEVHEASYGSAVGENTDLPDWLGLFRDRFDDVLRVDVQDRQLAGDLRNQIVVFKSCFPNNDFAGAGDGPGDAESRELTVANAQAALRALLEQFAEHPDVLFVYVTAPPNAPPTPQPAWKWLVKTILGRNVPAAERRQAAAHARTFNNWVRSPSGWLADYPQNNVVVFDYYDILTDNGASNSSAYPTGGGSDSHPSAEGNRRAAAEFVPFLNRAVRRAGLVGDGAGTPAPAGAPEPPPTTASDAGADGDAAPGSTGGDAEPVH